MQIQLKIIDATSCKFQGEVTSVQAPLYDGYATILHMHVPMIAILKEGQLKFKCSQDCKIEKSGQQFRDAELEGSQSQRYTIDIKKGFLRVNTLDKKSHVTIVVDESNNSSSQ